MHKIDIKGLLCLIKYKYIHTLIKHLIYVKCFLQKLIFFKTLYWICILVNMKFKWSLIPTSYIYLYIYQAHYYYISINQSISLFRNCLVSEDYSIKLTDVGMFQPIHTSCYYTTPNQRIPLRWIPWETITRVYR